MTIIETYRNRTDLMRQRTADEFPEPGPVYSMLYGGTELFGEMIDAIIRRRRPDDKRNNHRDHDPIHEFGQAIVMYRTAENQFARMRENDEHLSITENDAALCKALAEAHRTVAEIFDEMADAKVPPSFMFAFLDVTYDDIEKVLGANWLEAERMACEAFEAKHANGAGTPVKETNNA